MGNKKLKLDALKVQSFITELDKENGKTMEVQGGGILSVIVCQPTQEYGCPTYKVFACDPFTTTRTLD